MPLLASIARISCLLPKPTFVLKGSVMLQESKNDAESATSHCRLVRSVPNIPRGDEGLVESLRAIVRLVQADAPLDSPVDIPGSSSHSVLRDCCVSLHAIRFVRRTKYGFALSPEMETWLENGDNLYLAGLLAERCFFFGGLLENLDAPKTARELWEISKGTYGATWKVLSEVQARLKWC